MTQLNEKKLPTQPINPKGNEVSEITETCYSFKELTVNGLAGVQTNRGPAVLMLHWGIVHTEPEKFQSAALFLRLGLPSTLVRLFENAPQTGEIPAPGFRIRVDGKPFQSGAFRERYSHYNHVIL